MSNPDGSHYMTVVFRVPPQTSPDYPELSQILAHPWARQRAAGDHLSPELNSKENTHGPRSER